mmetsp:Transcript_114100/g.261853  ORF Transcript_114100/g.261853 Transcript_114100/m.261853 type:complete len:223 (-) Transcript_114100:370-1038(-)
MHNRELHTRDNALPSACPTANSSKPPVQETCDILVTVVWLVVSSTWTSASLTTVELGQSFKASSTAASITSDLSGRCKDTAALHVVFSHECCSDTSERANTSGSTLRYVGNAFPTVITYTALATAKYPVTSGFLWTENCTPPNLRSSAAASTTAQDNSNLPAAIWVEEAAPDLNIRNTADPTTSTATCTTSPSHRPISDDVSAGVRSGSTSNPFSRQHTWNS